MTNANSLDEHSTVLLRDFVASEWARFMDHIRENCRSDEEAEREADLIYKKLGGED